MERAAEEEARAMRAHNAAMERAAADQARAAERQAREAAKQTEMAKQQARDAQRAASARCARCANYSKCVCKDISWKLYLAVKCDKLIVLCFFFWLIALFDFFYNFFSF